MVAVGGSAVEVGGIGVGGTGDGGMGVSVGGGSGCLAWERRPGQCGDLRHATSLARQLRPAPVIEALKRSKSQQPQRVQQR